MSEPEGAGVGEAPAPLTERAARRSPFSDQAASKEREDSGLVLDDQDLHTARDDPNADDLQMTGK